MIKITEEQRDRLLDLCETSKSVSSDYDKLSEINESIASLPNYLMEGYSYPDIDNKGDNVQEKLNMINDFINEELC